MLNQADLKIMELIDLVDEFRKKMEEVEANTELPQSIRTGAFKSTIGLVEFYRAAADHLKEVPTPVLIL